MNSPQVGEWCAHVTYQDNSIKEITFDSPSNNRHVAAKYIVDYLQLTGVNDPSIKGMRLQEISTPNSKKHYFGRIPDPVKEEPETIEVTRSDTENKREHKYVVQLFVSPQVTTSRRFTIWAANPLIALNAARGMAGVNKLYDLGPYCVQEVIERHDKLLDLTVDTLVTKMIKGNDSFPGVGRIDTYGSIPDRPKVSQVAAVAVAKSSREEFVSEAINILKQETVTTRRAYTIKQDA